MTATPSVLFVCVKNSGKSQMAAALMRHRAGDGLRVYSAGTHPGQTLNALSVQTLTEVGVDVGDEYPKPIDPALAAGVDAIVVIGRQARLDPPPGPRMLVWDTDEPSERGIDGIERMRLIRDDLTARVGTLCLELTTPRRPVRSTP
ncbi:arsenate-mycothiol transferase ArsC [Nocardia aurantiaca]|uniref:Low molecular weight phosphatase family protein n=1 Tax=Nocardia aurantiaca TaxID=2675850 RepID=A0A6I3L1N0_9NOCA|nr:low molecular weight phosphatase family protein [Nocardia aurantiaca]